MSKPDRSTAVNPETVKVGDRVIAQNYEHMTLPYHLRRFRSEPTTVTEVATRDTGDGVTLQVEGSIGRYGYEWFAPADEPEAPEEPSRPTIDFSQSRYSTAREYAGRHRSKVNKVETNALLQDVADGEQVDAYALNEAILDAMRGATTRAGQSPLRRRHATEIAHLGHIVQAVLENHADGLPAYAQGDRSRLVETLQGEIHALQTAGADAITNLEKSTAKIEALQEELRAASTEIENLKDGIATKDAALDDLSSVAATRDGILADTVRERDVYKAAVTYILASLSDEHKQRVHGYIDGYQDGTNPSA